MMRPLLILACSATKRHPRDEVSAYELYDGPAYRVLRASGWPNTAEGPDCRVKILSAEHGLISAWRGLRHYDRMMDAARAAELAALDPDSVRDKLFCPVTGHRDPRADFEHFPASEVFVWGGALYRQVVKAWEAVGVFDNVPGGVSYSAGGIGVQLGQLKAWLVARGAAQRTGRVA